MSPPEPGYSAGPVGKLQLARFPEAQIHKIIDRMEADGEAHADVATTLVGQEAAAAGAWDLSAELHKFHVAPRSEDSTWKVIRAAPFAPH